jgi:ABC-type lipoprotein export system ATPase subunit
LSGGQRQRLHWARNHFLTQLEEKTLWLLDDPVSALDVNTEQNLVKNLLLPAIHSKNISVLFSTHRKSIESLAQERVHL